MKIILFIFLVCLGLICFSQHPDSLKAPISFGRLVGNVFTGKIKEEKYGRSINAFGKTYFMNNALPLNNRRYIKVGIFYHRFEKYCNQKGIYYNKKELRRYRKRACLSGLIFGLACFGFFPVAIDAQNYAQKSGNYTWPDMYFASPRAPLLWALPVLEGVISCKMRGAAERRLRDSIFDGVKKFH